MTIQEQIQEAIDLLELKINAKFTDWSTIISGKFTEIYKALQVLWDRSIVANNRITAVEQLLGGLTASNLTPTISRGSYDIENIADLNLPVLLAGEYYTLEDIATAAFNKFGISPELGTYGFTLLNGSIQYATGSVTNQVINTFNEDDTAYVKVIIDGSYTAKVLAIQEPGVVLSVSDLTTADPNSSATLSADFLLALA
jgi:hypothetical protein